MRVIKFTINENYYEEFKNKCFDQDITVKKKLNVLIAQDSTVENIKDLFPEDHNENPRKITLKVNEELFKSIMKKCGTLDLKIGNYMPYLIYRYLANEKIAL